MIRNEPATVDECDVIELQLELNRHHRDFEAIQQIVNESLDNGGFLPVDALRKIRGIVG